jgi:hypothetical protein
MDAAAFLDCGSGLVLAGVSHFAPDFFLANSFRFLRRLFLAESFRFLDVVFLATPRGLAGCAATLSVPVLVRRPRARLFPRLPARL